MSARDTATGRPRAHRDLLIPTREERVRHWRSRFFTGLCGLSAVVVLVPLLSILLYIGRRGLPGLSIGFFTHLPKPVGEDGGGRPASDGKARLRVACRTAMTYGVPLAEVALHALTR